MLGALTLILLCQLVGEIITKLTKMPVPGPVIGMVILFCILYFFPAKMPHEVETVGGFLLRYLALLFVPAGVGVITNLDLLMRSFGPIAGVIVVGTFVTIAVTGVVMQLMNRRYSPAQKESGQ
jgi:holin-like protein